MMQHSDVLKISRPPNFTEAIDFVMDAVTLAVRHNRPIKDSDGWDEIEDPSHGSESN